MHSFNRVASKYLTMNLDEDIVAKEDLVLDLRQRHNALILAVNAPTDILYAIFSL